MKQGRPPIDNPQTERVHLRCTPDEKRAWSVAAAAHGLPLGAWLRLCVACVVDPSTRAVLGAFASSPAKRVRRR